MIDKKYNYAVIGASANSEKYGYKVLNDLKTAGYCVYPVNPKGGEMLGLTVYPDIANIPEKIDVAIFVVPPPITEKILKTIFAKNIKNVWLQPGSESDQAIKYCQEHNINCIHHACIMLERKK